MSHYDIFAQCFPDLKMTEEIFTELSRAGHSTILEEHENGRLAGFAFVEGNALRLLCVDPQYRNMGFGSRLLAKAEELVRARGCREIKIGDTSSELFIGAPECSLGFFERRGYASDGFCDEMTRTIGDFSSTDFPIDLPQGSGFGWYSGSHEALLHAVADVDEDWTQYFTPDSRVFCAFFGGEITSFCLVDPDSQCILSDGRNKVGVIGCVGTVHRHRRKGLGLKMVALASDELNKAGCDLCFIHYTSVADWYAKLGYKTFLRQHFLKKALQERN